MGKNNKSFSPASQGNHSAAPRGAQKTPEQRRQEREDRKKRNQELAAKPNARVMEVATPYSDVIFQIHRQMDLVWMHLKARSGEPGGVSYEQMGMITEELQRHICEYDKLTKKLAGMVGWSYRTPDKLKPILQKIREADAAQNQGAPVAVPQAAQEKIHTLPAKAAKPQTQKPGKEKKVAAAAAK